MRQRKHGKEKAAAQPQVDWDSKLSKAGDRIMRELHGFKTDQGGMVLAKVLASVAAQVPTPDGAVDWLERVTLGTFMSLPAARRDFQAQLEGRGSK